MKLLRRFTLGAATTATIGAVAILALSSTPAGTALLRSAGNNLVVTANAGGGGGGGFGGNMALNVAPSATLVGKVDATVHVTYTCDAIFDPFTGQFVTPFGLSGQIFVQVQQRVGNSVANGQGVANIQPGMAECDGGVSLNPTVNSVDVSVTPYGASLKNGTAEAQAFGNICETSFSSFGPGPCDSGQSSLTTISIHN